MRFRWFFAVALFLAPAGVFAQPLADKLPADTVVYFGWRGAADLGPGYDQSHLKAILDASEMGKVFNDFLPAVMRKFGQQEQDAAEVMDVLSAFGPALWNNPCAFYFGGVRFPDQGPPMPRMAILCQAGNDAPRLMEKINGILKQVGEEAPFPMAARAANGLVVVTIGQTPQLDALTGGPAEVPLAPLVDHPAFKQALAQVQSQSVFALYIDAEAAMQLVDEAMTKMAPPSAKDNWQKARETLGLGGLQRIICTGGFDGKDWSTQAFIAAPAPRAGIVGAMLEGQPLSEATLKCVPRSASMVSSAQFDLNALFDGIRKIVSTDERTLRDFDAAISKANAATGLDIQKDLLQPLGKDWVAYTATDIGGNGILGLTVINRLNDPARFEKSAGQLEQYANQAIAREMGRGPKISFAQTKYNDLTVHYLAVPVVAPAWTIRDGTLYMAFYPQVAAAAAQSAGGKSILDNEDFIALRKRLGDKPFTSIQFADLPRTAGDGYQMILLVSRLYMGMGDIFGIQSPPMAMPPLNKITPHLTPAGSGTWSDAAGWHMKSVTPFPGAGLLNSQFAFMNNATTTTPLLVSILLPALNSARERANRVKCASNLSQIGRGCFLYANDNKDACPPDLGTLVTAADIPPEVFVCPSGVNQAPAELRGKPKESAEWANANADYVYLGADKKISKMHADEIMAHEKLDHHSGEGLNVLFGDGHVEWMTIESFKQKLGEQPVAPRGGRGGEL